jgi:MFS family permease
MSDGGDALDDLLGARKPRRTASDALDDMIKAANTTRDAGAALDDIIGAAGARPHGEEQIDRSASRKKWTTALALALGALGFAGVLTDAVAVTQLVSHSGAKALGYVYPIGGAGLLLIAIFQNRFIDRFARKKVLAWLCATYAVFSLVILALYASSVPTAVPSALGLLLADQINFMLPLLIWTLAGDIFTAGQTVTVYPVMSRWLYGGQVLGFAAATGLAIAANAANFSLAWLLIAPPVICVLVAVVTPKALADAGASEGHGRSETSREAARQSFGMLRDLPAFKWLFIGSFAVMAAGAIIEFGFFDVVELKTTRPGTLQAIYAGMFLFVILTASVLQGKVAGRLLNRFGAGRMLQLLPLMALGGAVVLVIGGAAKVAALAVIASVLWKLPRQSLDNNARQLAMATIPDAQRARLSNLINLVPVAVAYLVVAGPIGLTRLVDSHWVAPLIAIALAILGVMAARRTAKTWDDTQLSYRLKRRKRLG